MKAENRIASIPLRSLVLFFTLFDLVAVGCYWLRLQGVLDSRFFKLARDRGLAEIIQYCKILVVISALYLCWKVAAGCSSLLRAWLLFLTIVLIDDSVGIHEEVGEVLNAIFTFPSFFGSRPKDAAELLVVVVLEGSAICYTLWEHFRCNDSRTRKLSRHIVLAFLPLVFFATVFDLLRYPTIESLGEMASMTLLMVLVVGQARNFVKETGHQDRLQ